MFSRDKLRHLLLMQNILRLLRATGRSLFPLLSRTSSTQTKAGAGRRESWEQPKPWLLGPGVVHHLGRIKSSPNGQSASLWSASLSAVSSFPESIICYSEPSVQGGCIPAVKEKPLDLPEEAKGNPNTAPRDLSSASSG